MLCSAEATGESNISVCPTIVVGSPIVVVAGSGNDGTADNGQEFVGGGEDDDVKRETRGEGVVVGAEPNGEPQLKVLDPTPPPCVVVSVAGGGIAANLSGDSYHSSDSSGAPRYCDDPYCQLKGDGGAVQLVGDGRAWKCDVCCKQFSQKHHLQTHLLCHSGLKRFECQVCHKAFKQQAHLNTHLLIHEGRRPHRCPHCEHSFLQVTHLKRHMVTHGGSCLPCGLCGRRFAFPSDLSAHVAKHHPPPLARTTAAGVAPGIHQPAAHQLQCEVCERLFQYPSQLRDHMLVHTQVRRFACHDCGMRFMKEHHLRNHLVTHSPVKPFPCPVCGRAFSLKANMERHVLIHEAQRRFGCDRCGKRFSQPQTLKMHLVSHAEVKPYSCSVCGKGLARAHNLRAHMAIHQTSKPHRCPDCTSTFTLRGNLVRHLKEKHASTLPGEAVQTLLAPASPQRGAAKRRKNIPKRLKKFGEASGDEDGNEDCEDDEADDAEAEHEAETEDAEAEQETEVRDRFQDLSGHKYQGLPGSPETAGVASRNPEVIQMTYYPAMSEQQHHHHHHHHHHNNHNSGDPPALGAEQKPFSLHALQPAPLFTAPGCFYGELPSATPAAVGAEEVGARLQALHAAIDDLAGKLGPDHDKVTALHAALDQLVPPSQQATEVPP
ncbi:hypothetical protein HPB47_012874 [Ixodes persulcatus]|uniref:Uncharacterized protein n=1 Tax=Ixodes persulcatus TaxID=34615 RepID=A0AC60NSI0_IXOPE|nr:hypothetical protein HPB47_012874 [Ixodes persulcatus]